MLANNANGNAYVSFNEVGSVKLGHDYATHAPKASRPSFDYAAGPTMAKAKRKLSDGSKWNYRVIDGQEWTDPHACAELLGDKHFYHGNISRAAAEARLVQARVQRLCKATSNVFLLREKDVGKQYALSVLSPQPEEGDYISLDVNSVTHHLIKRAVRSDGTPGTHFTVNAVRLRECRTIYAVLAELSKPDGERMHELRDLPGLPINECCLRPGVAPTAGGSEGDVSG